MFFVGAGAKAMQWCPAYWCAALHFVAHTLRVVALHATLTFVETGHRDFPRYDGVLHRRKQVMEDVLPILVYVLDMSKAKHVGEIRKTAVGPDRQILWDVYNPRRQSLLPPAPLRDDKPFLFVVSSLRMSSRCAPFVADSRKDHQSLQGGRFCHSRSTTDAQ